MIELLIAFSARHPGASWSLQLYQSKLQDTDKLIHSFQLNIQYVRMFLIKTLNDETLLN